MADDQQQQQKAKVTVQPGDVVSFVRTDPILLREYRGIGVVVAADDDGADVRPLDSRTLRLAGDEVTALTGADVTS